MTSQVNTIDHSVAHDFSEGDWQAYSGAERFADGSEPVTRSWGLKQAVADKNGIEIIFFADDEYDEAEIWSRDRQSTRQPQLSTASRLSASRLTTPTAPAAADADTAKDVLNMLPDDFSQDHAKALGFEHVGDI